MIEISEEAYKHLEATIAQMKVNLNTRLIKMETYQRTIKIQRERIDEVVKEYKRLGEELKWATQLLGEVKPILVWEIEAFQEWYNKVEMFLIKHKGGKK